MIRRVFLVGMMGAGKSTVGKRVAEAMGWEFMDTDAMIEEAAGMRIPEIFSRKGEAYFRELEKEAVAKAGQKDWVVVATGGGAVLSAEAWRVMEAEGSLSVYLEASVATLTRQVSGSGERPLLSGGPGKIAEILRARRAFYQRAKARVKVDGKTPGQVAAHVIWELEPDFSEVDEGFLVGRGTALSLPEVLRERGYRRTFLITDKMVWNLYGQNIAQGLKSLGPLLIHMTPGGEASKTINEAQRAWRAMKAGGMDRESPVIAFGGGSVGDLGGFVASTYMRGLPFYQVPTTLLAMLDSSLGGKNALNMGRLKNLIGTFYFPERVLADTVFLLTLSKDGFSDGLAEAIKMSFIVHPELLDLLREKREDILSRNLSALGEMVALAGKAKLGVVREDPYDRSKRHILNLGHTVGHALELSLGLSHGHAVSIGMVKEVELGLRMGITPRSVADEVMETLSKYGLPTDLPEGFEPAKALALISRDKKISGGKLIMPMIRAIGSSELFEVSPDDLIETLKP
ncbi:MAG: 3-dehydroquinate synthase [candidate division WOR-3 bacterium]